MAGNTWSDNKCAPAKQSVGSDQPHYDAAAPSINHLMTYADYLQMAETCFSTPGPDCKTTWVSTDDFKLHPPTGKAGVA